MKNILVVAGTRPNFIKISQFRNCVSRFPSVDLRILHTGQHFDRQMSKIFFEQLHLQPDFLFDLTGDHPAEQLNSISRQLDQLITQLFIPDLVMVVGDVNSTRIAAETAWAHGIRIAHVESGLRSFDTSMPEEHNRIAADKLSTFHFVTEESGIRNLKAAGFSDESIFFSGNTMIDTLVAFSHQIENDQITDLLHLEKNNYALVTLHRPGNVDSYTDLSRSIDLLKTISTEYPIVFPVHPRTANKLKEWDLEKRLLSIPQLITTSPLGYFSFQKLVRSAACVITDSGGVQEESTFYKIPCLTIRPNTERPSTIEIGSNTLVNFDQEQIHTLIGAVKNGTYKKGEIPPLWDGKATERIFQFLSETW